jgi:hypothetical protein
MPRRIVRNETSSFAWIPGNGPSAQTLANMQGSFTRPSKPPGEAWFMSQKRRMYTEFIDNSPSEIPSRVLSSFLFEAASGIGCFPELTDDIALWRDYYRYLLPELIARSAEGDLLESTITAFFSLYRDRLKCQLGGSSEEVIYSLGRAVMMPQLFDENGESVCVKGLLNVADKGYSSHYDGSINASMFFCLSFLNFDDIATWAESVFAIDSAYFQVSLLTWLAGSYPLLTVGTTSFAEIERSPVEIQWTNSFLLEKLPPFIPKSNIDEFLKTLRLQFTIETLFKWLDNIARYPSLYEPLSRYRVAEIIHDDVLTNAMPL